MKIVLFLMSLLYGSAIAADKGVLTGVTRLSCEALLCLSSGTRPSPCSAALSYYFAISKTTWPATFAARQAFLKICPTGDSGLATVIANGAGRCDGPTMIKRLNAMSQYIGVSESERFVPSRYQHLIPSHCLAYYSHPHTAELLFPKSKKDCKQSPAVYPFGFNPYQVDQRASQSMCRLIWVWR